MSGQPLRPIFHRIPSFRPAIYIIIFISPFAAHLLPYFLLPIALSTFYRILSKVQRVPLALEDSNSTFGICANRQTHSASLPADTTTHPDQDDNYVPHTRILPHLATSIHKQAGLGKTAQTHIRPFPPSTGSYNCLFAAFISTYELRVFHHFSVGRAVVDCGTRPLRIISLVTHHVRGDWGSSACRGGGICRRQTISVR